MTCVTHAVEVILHGPHEMNNRPGVDSISSRIGEGPDGGGKTRPSSINADVVPAKNQSVYVVYKAWKYNM